MALRLLAQSAGVASHLFRCAISNQGIWDAYLLEEGFEGERKLGPAFHVPDGNVAKVGGKDLGAVEASNRGSELLCSEERVSKHGATETFVSQHAVVSSIPMVKGRGEHRAD